MMLFAVFCYLVSVVGAFVIGWNRGYVLGEEEAFRQCHGREKAHKRTLGQYEQLDKPKTNTPH